MTTLTNPRDRILQAFAALPAKQRQLARYILDHEDVVAFASASDLSQQAGASAATVVRFCRALGYEGYTDFQAAFRARIPQYQTAVEKLSYRISNGGFPKNLPAQVAETNIRNIQQTLSQVSETELNRAVEALIQARQIRIFAGGISAAAAVFAEHAFNVLGLPARACTNGGLAQLMELSRLTPEDVVVGISVYRYLRDTVNAVKAAREVGATCIAVTDSPVSTITSLADHVFIAGIEGALHSRSITGILSLLDLLSAAIAAARPQKSMEALQRIDHLYRKNGLVQGD